MAQSTAIDWACGASNLSWRAYDKSRTPNRTDFKLRDPLLVKDKKFEHFKRTFLKRLTEFKTSRLVPAESLYHEPIDGKLFSDEVLNYTVEKFGLEARTGDDYYTSIHINPLNRRFQKWQTWFRSDGCYTTSDLDLADALKTLMIIAAYAQSEKPEVSADALNAILILCKNPQLTPVGSLNHLSWGHSFGVGRVIETTLPIYCILNLLHRARLNPLKARESVFNKPTNASPYNSEKLINILIYDAMEDYDGPCQNIPHYQFWKDYDISRETKQRLVRDRAEGIGERLIPDSYDLDPQGLKDYLRRCFALLVIYRIYSDLTDPEGSDEKWHTELNYAMFRDRYVHQQDERE